MAFRFTLGSLLRFRRILEDRERLRLEGLLAQQTALRNEFEEVRAISTGLREQSMQSLSRTPKMAAEIQFESFRIDGYRLRELALQKRILDERTLVTAQTSSYTIARRQREVLDSLRDTQLTQYQLLQQRREQTRLDELYLLRRRHSP